MLKRPLCGLAIGFLLGIFTFMTEVWYGVLAVIAAIVAVAVCTYKEKQWRRGAFALLIFISAFLLGNYRYQYKWQIREACQSQLVDGMHLRVQGKLDNKEYKNNQYIYYLKDCFASFQTGILPCNQIIVYSNTDDASIGKTLIINGTMEHFQIALNEGNFDETSYYASRGIDFKLTDITIEMSYGKESSLREKLYEFRKEVKQVYEAYMTEADAGVMSAMTLGDKSVLDAEIKELYQGAGISHIMAISGLHISVIGMSFYKMLRRIGLSYRIAGIAAGSCMISYGFLTGFGPSTMRAILMFLLMLLGQALGRSYDSLTGLAAAAVYLLWENPFLLQYAGFLFSFAAVIGVVVIGKALEKIFLPQRKLVKTLLVSLGIQLTTVPLVAFFYYEIPTYAMLINLVVIPFLNILLFLGLAGGIGGMGAGFIAKICFLPCHCILYLYQELCEMCKRLPGANMIIGKPEGLQIFLYYIIFIGMLAWLWKRSEGREQTKAIPREENASEENVFAKKEVRKRRYIFVGSLMAAFLVLLWNPQKGLEVDVLSVGQGDGIFLQTGEGYHLFIDGGSTDVKKVGTYRILPFFKAKGIRKIDYWFVTHTDTDHISGLQELLEVGYPVENLIFSKEIEKDEVYEKLRMLAEEQNTKLIHLQQGDCMHFGEGKLTCLFPDGDYDSTDKNGMSLVIAYEEDGFSAIFTGDINEAAERRMVESGVLSKTIFYKVAHHGSNGSNSKEFLEALQPKIAVISCGKNNSYGHPHKETLERLSEENAVILTTSECGEIMIEVGEEIKMYGFTKGRKEPVVAQENARKYD